MVKYQFFVGSTYKDLVDERQVAINAIIETNNIVAGMEFFGAVGENQLEHIKQEIDQTDYYLLIIGGRYGSLTKSGISYTEEEYDYAVLNGVRVIAFIHIDEKNELLLFPNYNAYGALKTVYCTNCGAGSEVMTGYYSKCKYCGFVLDTGRPM